MAQAGIRQRVIRERAESGSGRRVNALSFHSLRHTFNSALANPGIPEETRMALTGHTSRQMNQTLWLLLFTKFLETRITPERIEHGIEPEQRRSQRHVFSQRPRARHRK